MLCSRCKINERPYVNQRWCRTCRNAYLTDWLNRNPEKRRARYDAHNAKRRQRNVS